MFLKATSKFYSPKFIAGFETTKINSRERIGKDIRLKLILAAIWALPILSQEVIGKAQPAKINFPKKNSSLGM